MLDFKLFRRDKNIGQKVLIDLFSCTQGYISALETGRKQPTSRQIELLQAKFGDISRYITNNTNNKISDNGEMLKKDTTSVCNLTLTKEDKISALNKMIIDIQHNGKKRDKIHFVPLMNIDAVGGVGNDVCDTPEYIEELIPVVGARDSSICIPVSGDSMTPIFLPGDLVVIDEVIEWSLFLEMGQYYVIALKDNRRLIKKITYSEIDRKSNFLLLSENPNYPPVELPKTLIYRMFIVTQKHQRLTL